MFAREGYPFMVGAATLAALVFAAALKFRSWPLWLGALLLTIVALCVAWFFRDPVRTVGVSTGGHGFDTHIHQRPAGGAVQYAVQRALLKTCTSPYAGREASGIEGEHSRVTLLADLAASS